MSEFTPRRRTDEIDPLVPELSAPARADGGPTPTRDRSAPMDGSRPAAGALAPLVPDLR